MRWGNKMRLGDKITLPKLAETAGWWDAMCRVTTTPLDSVWFAWTTANGRGRLQQIKAGTSVSLTLLQDLRYTYDATGNITRTQDWKAASTEEEAYTYDALNRLTWASGAYNETYQYNGGGNLTWNSAQGGAYYYSLSKPHAVESTANGASYGYDANGNMTTRTIGVDVYVLSYDAENRLTLVTKNGNPAASFGYDGDAAHGFGHGWHGTRHPCSHPWTAFGSTTVNADVSAAKQAEIRYTAWGVCRYTSGTMPASYRFTGQRQSYSTSRRECVCSRWLSATGSSSSALSACSAVGF